MENHFPFHKISDLENMIINILNEGNKTIWQWIEQEKNAILRCKQRKIYSLALKGINKRKL